jgi:outer membrane protein
MTKNRISTILAVVLCVGLSFSAHAQSTAQHKIGVVNLKDVFDNYDKQKESYENLKVERDKAQKPIDELSAKITADKQRYESEASTMPEEERRKLKEKIESDFSMYQAEFQRLQKDIDRKEKNMLEGLFDNIQKAIEEVGAQENYHMIFEGGKNTRNGLLYYSTTLNMTQKVIDHLNAK